MDELYTNLVASTKTNISKRIENEREKHVAHQMKIKSAMTNLFSHIIDSNVSETMKAAAAEGYDKCEIFSFEKGQTFQDLPLIFLTRGPNKYNGFGMKYFEEINIIPYVKQLQQHFAPFNIFFTTNHKTGKTLIFVSWENKF